MSKTDYSKVDTSKYSKDYNETSFWEKVRKFAAKAGGKVIYNALVLYYALQSTNTPAWAKTVILGALGYFIAPIDLIPDITPGVGFVDDAGVIAAALATIAVCITPEIKDQAKKQLKDWFGDSEIAQID
jgi:uncharacterized membrane protein YkvA (DUF1232 family)